MGNNEKENIWQSENTNREFRAWNNKKNIMLYCSQAPWLWVFIMEAEINWYKIMQKIPWLYDQNWLQIREWDVLDFDEKERRWKFKPEVIWLDKVIWEFDYCWTKSDVNQWRSIIWNIYQNPELLSER